MCPAWALLAVGRIFTTVFLLCGGKAVSSAALLLPVLWVLAVESWPLAPGFNIWAGESGSVLPKSLLALYVMPDTARAHE